MQDAHMAVAGALHRWVSPSHMCRGEMQLQFPLHFAGAPGQAADRCLTLLKSFPTFDINY